ncbi:PLD nuclease N-terminal domain-containing protein [Agromyces bauzanensis]
MENRRWSDLTSGQRARLLVAASVQLALAATAWADLANRPAAQVNGPKLMWAAIIAVNFVGPIAYFALGRRRREIAG